MYFHCVYPSFNFPRKTSFLAHLMLSSLPFSNEHQVQFVLPLYFGYMAFHWNRINTREHSLKRNLLSLSQQLSIVSRSSAKGGTLCPPPLFMSGLSLPESYACCHNCRVSICLSPLLCLDEYKASGLYNFCLLFCNDSEPWKKGI